ncbi:hypothetical protein BH10ACT7_BH10ACT7_13940 [soil metagenome]
MSGPPVRLPPPPNRALLPVLAAVTLVALIVGAWGVLSLVLDRDVIDYPDAGPLLGPAMVVAAAVVTWLVAWRARTGWSMSIAVFASYLVLILVGTIGYTLTTGDVSGMPAVAAHFAINPFVAAATVLSGLVVLSVRALETRPR